MSAVPSNIYIASDGPDGQGRIRAFAMAADKQIGTATAMPNDTDPGAWVISDMRFLDPDHWPSLGQTLLDRLVDHIEEIALDGRATVITASLANSDFRQEVERFGSRISIDRRR